MGLLAIWPAEFCEPSHREKGRWAALNPCPKCSGSFPQFCSTVIVFVYLSLLLCEGDSLRNSDGKVSLDVASLAHPRVPFLQLFKELVYP